MSRRTTKQRRAARRRRATYHPWLWRAPVVMAVALAKMYATLKALAVERKPAP